MNLRKPPHVTGIYPAIKESRNLLRGPSMVVSIPDGLSANRKLTQYPHAASRHLVPCIATPLVLLTAAVCFKAPGILRFDVPQDVAVSVRHAHTKKRLSR